MNALVSRFAAMWWLHDMAAPEFQHKFDDSQASLSEAIARRRPRPARHLAIAFCLRLESLLLEHQDPTARLEVELVPKGLLDEACKVIPGLSRSNLLSWFTVMDASEDIIVVRVGPRGNKRVVWENPSTLKASAS